MSRPIALLLLLLQIIFAALPGDGVVLCVGGEHGHFGLCTENAALGHCDEHGSGAAPEVLRTQGEPSELPAGDPSDHCRDCDGIHLTRGLLESWLPTVAPERALRTAGEVHGWLAPTWQPEHHSSRRRDAGRVLTPRRPPPPPTHALDIVRVTELRI